MFTWVDRLPTVPVLILAVFLGLAPFQPEPHLWEKLKMLADGTLSKPIDIFDMFMHGTLPILALLKFVRLFQTGNLDGNAKKKDEAS